MDLYYKIMQEEDTSKIKDVIAQQVESSSIEINMDNAGNIVIHKCGRGRKIMISALVDRSRLCITSVSSKKAEFELSGNINKQSLKDTEVVFQASSIGIVRAKEEEKKENEYYIDLWDENAIDKGDVCYLKSNVFCKGDILYGIDVSSVIPLEIIVCLINELRECVNDLYFTISFCENGVKSIVKSIKPDCLYHIYCAKSDDDFSISNGVGVVYKDGNAVVSPQIRNVQNKIAADKKIKTQPYIGKHSKLIEVLGITGEEKKIGALCIPVKCMGSGFEIVDINDIKSAEMLVFEMLNTNYTE